MSKFDDKIRTLLFIIGIRPAYRLENISTTLALITFIMAEVLSLQTSYIIITAIATLLIMPIVFQFISRYEKIKNLPKDKRETVPPPRVPLYTIIVTAIATAGIPLLFPVAILNILMIEDITMFVTLTSRVKAKHTFSILLEPFAKRQMFTTILVILIPSIFAYYITRSLVVFVYPVIAYVMIAYSLLLLPPEIQTETIPSGNGLAESVVSRIPLLYFLFRVFYYRKDMIRQGKEAGLIGNEYYTYIKKWAGIFTLSIYISLAITPLLYILLIPLHLVTVSFALPALIAGIVFYMPALNIKMKRSRRAGKISKNLLLILTYMSAMASVAERFTTSMENIKNNKQLAKMFGLDEEAKIYLGLYHVTNDESVALGEYADTIPDDFYRDTIRTMKDLLESEGYGATFTSIINRIKDFTARYIDKATATFQDIGSNIISTIILVETAVPIFTFLSDPMVAPIIIIMTGSLSGFLVAFITMTTMPDLPTEYIYTKQRFRMGAIIFVLSSIFLLLFERIFFTGMLLNYLVILNIIAGFGLVLDYVSKRDLAINNEFLNKFPDILVLFSSALVQSNSVERSLQDLSQQSTFSSYVRYEFKKLANMFALLNVEQIGYRGPYWYKYFLFLARIGASYGTAPRDLYKTIGDFMLEYKKFFSAVSAFGMSFLFLTIISIAILNMEVFIMLSFMHVFSSLQLSQSVGGFSFQSPLPTLTSSQIAQLRIEVYLSLLVVALANGIGLGRVIGGTFRSGKWIFMLYIVQILLIIIGIKTGFGFANMFSHYASS